MVGTIVRRAVLGAGVAIAFFAALPGDWGTPFLSRADAGPRAVAGRILRHRERTLVREKRHIERHVQREKRQEAGLKRRVEHLRHEGRMLWRKKK